MQRIAVLIIAKEFQFSKQQRNTSGIQPAGSILGLSHAVERSLVEYTPRSGECYHVDIFEQSKLNE